MKVVFTNDTNVNYNHLKNAVGNDDLRPVMTQVYIDFIAEKIVVTDAHVLITYPITLTENNSNLPGVIVPPELFYILKYNQKIKPSDLDNLSYHIEGDIAFVKFNEDIVYSCKLEMLDQKYPNWEAVFPVADNGVPITEIGIHLSVYNKIIQAIPKDYHGTKFTFFGLNKGILIQSTTDPYYTIKALLMPTHLH